MEKQMDYRLLAAKVATFINCGVSYSNYHLRPIGFSVWCPEKESLRDVQIEIGFERCYGRYTTLEATLGRIYSLDLNNVNEWPGILGSSDPRINVGFGTVPQDYLKSRDVINLIKYLKNKDNFKVSPYEYLLNQVLNRANKLYGGRRNNGKK